MRSFRDYKVHAVQHEDPYLNFGVYLVKKNGCDIIRSAEVFSLKNITQEDCDKIMQEVRVMASLRHPFILMYYDCFVLEMTSQLVVVTEYCQHGDLHQYIDEIQSEVLSKTGVKNNYIFSEKQALKLFTQMVLALKELQRHGLVHRNFKPKELYVDGEAHLKLADFMYASYEKVRNVATEKEISYMSPEMLQNQIVTIKSDVWSLGIILYEMTFGKKPFYSKDRSLLETQIIEGEFEMPENVMGYPRVKLIVEACLKVNPEQRPSLDLLLKYPFLQEPMKENFERYPDLELIEKELHPITLVRELKFNAESLNMSQLNKALQTVKHERIIKVLKSKDNSMEVPWPLPLGNQSQLEPLSIDHKLSLPPLKDNINLDKTISSIHSPEKTKQDYPPGRVVDPLPPLMFEIRRFGHSRFLSVNDMRRKLAHDYQNKITDIMPAKKLRQVKPSDPLMLQGAEYGKIAEKARWDLPNIE